MSNLVDPCFVVPEKYRQLILDELNKNRLASSLLKHDVQFVDDRILVAPPTFEPVRRHRRRRIQKKWNKRYGMKRVEMDRVVVFDRSTFKREVIPDFKMNVFTPEHPDFSSYADI